MAPVNFMFLAFLSLHCVTYALLENILGSSVFGDIFPNMSNERCARVKNFTTFLLCTRNNQTDCVLVTGDKRSLEESEFDPSIPTKMIIHGFLDNLQISDWMIKMKTEILIEGYYNVIIVDWSCGNGMPYNQAVENTRMIADEVAELIKFLKDTVGAEPLDFHLIGHSLGSQIAAIVGQKIHRVGRITGLDPAGPKFYDAPLDQRLDPTDAEFVDVIHTDAGSGLFEGFGMHEQIGHVDFYPNGGKTQPGCHSSPFQMLHRIGFRRAARHFFVCDHVQAIEFFIASIRKPECDFVGVACKSWEMFTKGRCANCSETRCAKMGFHSDRSYAQDPNATTEEFYLRTSEHAPFCLYQYQIVVRTGGNNSGEHFVVKDGVLNLELKSQNETYRDFKLNESGEDLWYPGKNYVYLMTSGTALEDVKSATLSWERKKFLPWTLRSAQTSSVQHLKINRLQISQISMPNKESRKMRTALLCASDEEAVFENQKLNLSAGC